ncbi:hypothetical protein DW886_04645 [Enterocloster aldenensis]|nr:hypothetical protein DW886_04645 [Enterocloster aldenensis]
MNIRRYKIWKRFVSVLLVFCLTCGLMWTNGGILAMASTELPDENLGEAKSEGTIAGWISSGGSGEGGAGASPASSLRFDLHGLINAADNSYVPDQVSQIITTFANTGYATILQIDGGPKIKANGPTNGSVENLTSLGLELKIALSASPDNKYILADYYIYDTSGQGGQAGRDVKLGTGADIMIGGGTGNLNQNDDYATIYKNDNGFHMVNCHVYTTFDCITDDDSLGVTPPDTRWVGRYSQWGGNVFNESQEDISQGQDSGLAYSWNFKLRPYEMVHKRVAFAIRDTSYYVSSASGADTDSTDGTYSHPFKTIEYALERIGNKKGYVYVMDYPDISASISLTGSNQDITITSTNFDTSGTTVSGIQTLQRASSYGGEMFHVTGGAILRLTDIILDGGGIQSPDSLVNASGGRLEINSGATIQNCHGNPESMGSAVNITGSASLSMNFGKVSENKSEGKGAVYFDSSGTFEVIHDVSVEDNQTPSGGKSNVYLGDGKVITVKGDLGGGRIGVTTARQPEVSPGGMATIAAHEVKIAVPGPGSSVNTAPSPFVDNFFADLAKEDGLGVYAAVGTKNLAGAGDNNDRNTVLKKNGLQISRFIREAGTGASITGAPELLPVSAASGDPVDIPAPGGVLGYELTGITIEQGTPPTLQGILESGPNFGKVTGTMPDQDVTVYYELSKIESKIMFESNGGTPQPPTLTGTYNEPVNALLPTISRYGYIFKGWSTNPPDSPHGPSYISKLPDTYPFWPVTYYAIFEADPNVKFDYTVEHENQSGTVVFKSTTQENKYSVDTPLHEMKKNVKGYLWSQEDSGTIPTQYDYNGTPQDVGIFQPNGAFDGKMPGQDATVRFRYKVDYDNPDNRYLLTVKHETGNFNVVAPDETSLHYPEDEIMMRPVNKYGYECVGYEFVRGHQSFDNASGLTYAIKQDFDDGYVFNGLMPNQPVTLTYLYKATNRYELSIRYEDKETGDEALRNIIPPTIAGQITADRAIGGQYEEQYGYTITNPSTDRLVKPDGATIWFGSFNNDWGGTMPNDDAQVIYRHDRIPSKWADITYKAGEKGSLQGGEGVSPDVQALAGGEFSTSVLIKDGTDKGSNKAYTLAQIKDKRLMPVPKAESAYYRFGGWFIDADGSGKLDGDETILPQDYQFDGPAIITAHFEEDPDAWITIAFEAGEHGSINAGEPLTLRTTYDKKWSDIQGSIPQCTPQVNYLPDGWYTQGEPVEEDTSLVNGQTYTMEFYPDPSVFGTDVSAPDAMAGLNTQGQGRVTIFGTAQGYKYILTDLAGEVLAVNKGNLLTSRTYFDGLYPGMPYLAYEATGSTRVEAGDLIGEIQGTVSDGTQVVTPVVETNYQVFYDEEEEGKTQLLIKPADMASDYAVLNHAGDVVHTPQTGAGGWQKPSGNPASLEFTGLDYNKEYTVVARPAGRNEMTAQDRREYGSTIPMDPGGELELPKYIIETVNGDVVSVGDAEVGGSRCEEAHKGDLVNITADSVNGAGQPFSHWEFAIGSVKGLEGTIRQREASFTMPDTNLVLAAVYQREASPSNARVVYEVRGGSRDELALDPDEVQDLEDGLTTDADLELMDVNRADVTYKVVYRKNGVKASESNAIKASGMYEMDHEEAYKGAWGLDVSIERYVNGRRVDRASASNASFRTYVQLEKKDVDMMDYQLYELVEDPDERETTVIQVPMDYEPEETGGLFTFTATEGSRYVMVYNRAYRLYFLNNTAPVESRYRYWFKVRRNGWPGQDYYETEYAGVEEQLDHFISPEGADFTYVGWSYRPDKLREFDPDRRITRKTYVYAFYEDNVQEVNRAREELEKAILEAIGLSDDHFLKLQESRKLKELIEIAQEVLDREPKATIGHLESALEDLKEDTAPYRELLEERYDHYDHIQEDGNKGGSGGGGGGGKGTKKTPFNGTAPKSYQAGTNGTWVESIGPNGEKQYRFRLNGGDLLRGMWARLEYPEAGQDGGIGWYRFDSDGNMQSGWICDETGKWYYCNTEKEGDYGKMATGWKLDQGDGHWYYLDPVSGEMATGWKQMDGTWYYFSPVGEGTYTFDPTKGKWTFGGGNGRPLGSMYKNEVTPDGYLVGLDGAWIQ